MLLLGKGDEIVSQFIRAIAKTFLPMLCSDSCMVTPNNATRYKPMIRNPYILLSIHRTLQENHSTYQMNNCRWNYPEIFTKGS